MYEHYCRNKCLDLVFWRDKTIFIIIIIIIIIVVFYYYCYYYILPTVKSIHVLLCTEIAIYQYGMSI